MEKSIPEMKTEFLCMCVREKNDSSVNLSFKKDFKFAEPLIKKSFFLYFRDRPENGEGNKQRRHRKYMRKSD